jgi:hypothetical protein
MRELGMLKKGFTLLLKISPSHLKGEGDTGGKVGK